MKSQEWRFLPTTDPSTMATAVSLRQAWPSCSVSHPSVSEAVRRPERRWKRGIKSPSTLWSVSSLNYHFKPSNYHLCNNEVSMLSLVSYFIISDFSGPGTRKHLIFLWEWVLQIRSLIRIENQQCWALMHILPSLMNIFLYFWLELLQK